MLTWQHRHRVLVSRLALLFSATFVVTVVGTVATYFLERHAPGTEVKTVFDAFYFTTTQLVTVSSSLKNPVTTAGRVLNILLEIWGVLIVAAVTGAFASFFLSPDSGA